MKVDSFLKHTVGGYGSGTKIDVVAEQRYAIRTNDGIGSTHVQINMRVVVGHRCTRASELLHTDLYVWQAVIVLELRVIDHVASRIVQAFDGLRRQTDGSDQSERISSAPMPAAISLIFAAKMKSFSCRPLIFLVCNTMAQ